MKTTARDHVVMDLQKKALVCGHCGTTAPITYGALRAVARAAAAFLAAHGKCRPGDAPRTRQIVPTAPVATRGRCAGRGRG